MLCPGCFEEKRASPICPHCGYDESLKRSPLVLPHHTPLNQGRYAVGRLLGKPGGFGLTYLAWDQRLLTRVAIKEYLPRELSGRDTDHQTVVPHSGEDAETFAPSPGRPARRSQTADEWRCGPSSQRSTRLTRQPRFRSSRHRLGKQGPPALLGGLVLSVPP